MKNTVFWVKLQGITPKTTIFSPNSYCANIILLSEHTASGPLNPDLFTV